MVADLQDRGVDIYDPELRRPWSWLRSHVLGLLAVPPVYVQVPTENGFRFARVQQTRLALALAPADI